MSDTVSMSEFGAVLTDLFEKEVMNAEETLDEVIHERALHLRGKLGQVSPYKTREYQKGWRIKTVTRNHERVRVIYNAARPELTYYLEYGTKHQDKQPHIRRALEEEIDDIIEELLARL